MSYKFYEERYYTNLALKCINIKKYIISTESERTQWRNLDDRVTVHSYLRLVLNL